MKKSKQIFAGLLAAVLTVTALPMTAAAEITTIEWGTKPEDGVTKWQPFPSGTGGSQNFRIPGIVTLNNGTIVAACDARWNHGGDACGLDTIVSRSTDNGENWNYTFANYLGDYGNKKHDYSTAFIDPAIATDGEAVYMIADVWPGGYAINTAPKRPILGNEFDEEGNLLLSGDDRSTYAYHLERNTAENASNDSYYVIKENTSGDIVEGYTIDAFFNITEGENKTNLFCANSPYLVYPTDYLYMTKSEDGGANWSIPSLLRMKKPTEKTLLVGPGRGIVTSTGRIVFTAYEYTDGDKNSACIYSDDGGLTWERGESVPQWSSEAAVVEADGKLYIFTRHGGYNVSEDWGETWSEKKTPDITYNLGCELSATTYSKKIDGKTAIIFSAPSNTGSRAAGKLFVGLVEKDGTLSWDYEYSVNGEAYYAYSCLTELKDGSIGLLYENGGAAITYTNIPISDVASGACVGDLWCENANGEIVTSIDMNSKDTVDLEVFCANTSADVTAVSDNEDLLNVSLENGKLTITSDEAAEEFAQGTVTLTGGTDTIKIIVNVTDAQQYEVLNLRMGDTHVITVDESVNVSVADDKIVKVSKVSDQLTILALEEGNTTVTAGDTKYFVTVKNDEKKIRLEKGESDVVSGSEILKNVDAKIVSVTKNESLPPYGKVDGMPSDGVYLIGNASSIITNSDSEDDKPLGRAMKSAYYAAEDLSDFLWTIQETDGGYTIQDKDGKYLSFGTSTSSSCDITISDIAQTLQIVESGDGFGITNGTHYLNNWANNNTRAAGYNSNNNTWYFYQGSDSYVITGLEDGSTSMVIDGTTYNITVVDSQKVGEVQEDLSEKMTDAESLLAQLEQGSLSVEYTATSIEALKQAYVKVQEIMDSEENVSLEDLQKALADLEKAMQLEKKELPKDPPKDSPKDSPKLPAAGSVQPYGDASYKVLTATATGGTVSYAKPAKISAKVVIPATIQLNNQTYKVVTIESSAFKGNKKLKNITIGANIEKIGKSAFEKCAKLTKITIQSSVLTKVEKNAIKNINKKCVIKVPKAKKANYKKLFKKAGLKSTMKVK